MAIWRSPMHGNAISSHRQSRPLTFRAHGECLQGRSKRHWNDGMETGLLWFRLPLSKVRSMLWNNQTLGTHRDHLSLQEILVSRNMYLNRPVLMCLRRHSVVLELDEAHLPLRAL